MRKLLLFFAGLMLAEILTAQTVDASEKKGRTDIDITTLEYAVKDRNAPAVYFVREISSESLVRVYKATGRKLSGNIALKVIFEDDGVQYIDPQLLKGLAQETKGTFIDSTYFTFPRNRSDGSLKMAQTHGFDKIAPCEIIDADGDMDLPVTGGNIVKYLRVGKGFAKYDAAVTVNLFKPHYLPQYDGISKALSIPFASRSGKSIIHSHGLVEDRYTNGPIPEFRLAIADSVKAANDSKPWIYINVLADVCVDDTCDKSQALGNIGILASVDPVAIDRAACDMTYGQAEKARQKEWEARHGVTEVLNAAEKIGAGKQHYRIIEIK